GYYGTSPGQSQASGPLQALGNAGAPRHSTGQRAVPERTERKPPWSTAPRPPAWAVTQALGMRYAVSVNVPCGRAADPMPWHTTTTAGAPQGTPSPTRQPQRRRCDGRDTRRTSPAGAWQVGR